jgi:hypothetical protein
MVLRLFHMKQYLLASMLVVSSCTTGLNRVGERNRYWEGVVHSEIPTGSSYADVNRWADSRHLRLTPGQSPESLSAGLEYVPVHNLVCKGFEISLQLTLNAERSVTQESVSNFGNCL